MSHTKPRYPGAQPFETAQQDIFFGREKDIEALCRKIRQEPLTVLYSKSGLGKSSLLNAGVTPRIKDEREYRPVRIRFNAYDKDLPIEGQVMPDVRCRKTARGTDAPIHTFLDQLIEDEPTLWHDLKEQQIIAHEQAKGDTDKKTPLKLLLIFDQFEELFTYPPEAVLSFRKQLAEALNTPLPSRYWDMLELFGQDESPLTDEQLALLQRPLDLRVVMAIRQDRMHLLGQLSDYLPSVSKTWYELRPLNRLHARQAITAPAAIDGDFSSPPFSYEGVALDHILTFLTKGGTEEIESTQLQIVCNSIEETATAMATDKVPSPVITTAEVGDLEAVIENYYMQKIAAVADPAERLAVRQLVEEGLIYEEEERRLSLYEGIILSKYGITARTLRQLVDGHLLRAEPSLQGGYTYELSHDTLVAPVLKAKEKRLEEAQRRAEAEAQRQKELELAELRRKAEAERQKAEQERQLREKAEVNEQRARQRTRLAAIVSVIALALALFAGWSYVQANRSAELAAQKSTEAEQNFQQAEANLAKAKEEEEKAKAALEQVEKEKAATEEQKRKAEENFSLAQKKTREAEANFTKATQANERVLESVLQYADAAILNMDYEKALKEADNAAGLKVKQAEVFPRYFEIAYWQTETGNTRRAVGILDTALSMMGKPKLSGTLGKQPTREQLREVMEKLDKKNYASLLRRYYPHMVFIKGGTFEMGCDSVSAKQLFDSDCPEDEKLHTVTLDDYHLAETETTWWQFGLYRAANGKNVWENRESWLPTGDHPVVNVSWRDAIGYANWVSQQFPQFANDTIYSGDLESDEVEAEWSKTGYRLPTEAEWEHAASGGRGSVFAGTSLLDSLHFYGNYSDESGTKDGFQYTSPSKRYLPNRWGLYDMSGNVWEWCWDWYDGNYYEDGQQNPHGPDVGSRRVYRGGSWGDGPAYLRCAYRDYWYPDFRNRYLGFRLARAAR